MDRGDAGPLQPALERQIEIRGVDADEQPRPRRREPAPELPPDPENLRKMPQHLDVAAHRELLHAEPGIEPLSLHFRAADAYTMQIGNALAQRGDEMRPEKISRDL